MTQNQHRAGGRNNRPAQSEQARKTTGQTIPAAPAGKSPATPPRRERECDADRVSRNRMEAFEGRRGSSYEPDIPGVGVCEWSEGALLDRMCAALYDAELIIFGMEFSSDFRVALAVARVVMQRVRTRGWRAQTDETPGLWGAALPGMQGAHCKTDSDALYTVADALYEARHQIVREVIPKLDLDRSLALADALVIAETNDFRQGASIDPMGRNRRTPVQECSACLRERWLQLHTLEGTGLSEDLPHAIREWAKGGGR